MAEAQQQRATGATVTVACKYPPGVILRIHKAVEKTEPVMGGGFRKYTQYDPIHDLEPVEIKGPTGFAFGIGARPGAPVVTPDGFALTPGVPKDFWDKWLEQNPDNELVKRGLLGARDRDIEGWASERKAVSTGLEPTDQDNPSKRLGRTRFQVSKDDGK
jgi:hypothetical protein